MLKRDWTAEEDNIIRELGSTVSVQRLAVRMKRLNTAVIARAKILNVQVKRAQRLKHSERYSY
jgi:hypothetical protein